MSAECRHVCGHVCAVTVRSGSLCGRGGRWRVGGVGGGRERARERLRDRPRHRPQRGEAGRRPRRQHELPGAIEQRGGPSRLAASKALRRVPCRAHVHKCEYMHTFRRLSVTILRHYFYPPRQSRSMADVMVDQGLPSASLDAPPEAEPLPAPSPEAEPLPAPSPAESKRDREAEDEIKCAFCHEGEDSDDPDEDPLVEVNAGRAKPTYAHDQCLWWCPDITQDDELRWVNVGSALRRCARLKCDVCGETHAPLGCKRKACRKSWHYPCAMEPSTGLVVYEDEFCVACPICHEVMERRERKKRMEEERKKAAKDAVKAAEKAAKEAAKAAAKEAAASAKAEAAATKKAAVVSSAALPPMSAQARVNSAGGGKAKAAVAVPKSKPAADGTSKKAAAVPAAVAASSTAPTRAAPPAPPPPPPPPAPPPPPPPDPKMVAAEAAIAKLFKDQRSEDLPLEMVKGAAGLADGDLDTLLKKMDDENKLMCRAGSVYLI